MPPSETASVPSGATDFKLLVEAVVRAVVAQIAAPVPQLLDQVQARRYCGLSKSGWFRAKSADLLPKSVFIEGSGERWKRRDLDAWIERQKPTRRKPTK